MKRETKYRKAIYELGYSLRLLPNGAWYAESVKPEGWPIAWKANTLEHLYSSLRGFK